MAIERIIAGLEKKSRVLSPRGTTPRRLSRDGPCAGSTRPCRASILSIRYRSFRAALGRLATPCSDLPEDRFLLARHDLENRISVLMGGRAAEALIFDGEVSTGASDDLQRATEIAIEMVTRYGMTDSLGPAPMHCPPQPFLTGTTANRIDASEATEADGRCGDDIVGESIRPAAQDSAARGRP